VVLGISVELVVYKCVSSPRTDHEGPEGGVEIYIYSLLASALMWVGGQRHDTTALLPRERPGTNFTEGWVRPQGRSVGYKYI
jgi:hypothetical protein